MQSCGIGKLLLDYIKNKKLRLRLNVYQKNIRALSFYQREGFDIQSEGLDEATGEKEYTMLWQQKQKADFWGEFQKQGAIVCSIDKQPGVYFTGDLAQQDTLEKFAQKGDPIANHNLSE